MVARATLLLAQPGRIHCRCRRRLRCLLRRDVTFRRTQAYSAMVAAALAFWVKALMLSGTDECARMSRLTDELIRMRRLCGQNPAGCNETVLYCCPGRPDCGPENRSFLSELHRRKPACCRQFVCKRALPWQCRRVVECAFIFGRFFRLTVAFAFRHSVPR